jgi:hypothetical protein
LSTTLALCRSLIPLSFKKIAGLAEFVFTCARDWTRLLVQGAIVFLELSKDKHKELRFEAQLCCLLWTRSVFFIEKQSGKQKKSLLLFLSRIQKHYYAWGEL